MKHRIFEIIEKSQSGDRVGFAFDCFIITLICLNVVSVIIGSFNDIDESVLVFLHWFELISIIIFTIEYGLRVWTAPQKYPASKYPYLVFIFSFMAIVDLLAFLPFYLPFITNVDLRYLRLLRLFRIVRIFKLNRYNNSFDLMLRVLRNEKEKLFMTMFILVVLLLFASSTMYFIENAVQPEQFPNILSTIWWAVATLTTIGYGDVFPVTALGKLMGGVIAILGIGIIALPTGIISSGLVAEVSNKETKPETHNDTPSTVVSSEEFADNQDHYFELALRERVIIKKGDDTFELKNKK